MSTLKDLEDQDEAEKQAFHDAQQMPKVEPTAQQLKSTWDLQNRSVAVENLNRLGVEHPEVKSLVDENEQLRAQLVEARAGRAPLSPPKAPAASTPTVAPVKPGVTTTADLKKS